MNIKTPAILLFFFFYSYGFSQGYSVVDIKIEASEKVMKNVNSSKDDFSPFFYKGYLYFASNREVNQFMGGEENWNKKNHVNIYRVKMDESLQKTARYSFVTLLSERLRFNGHSGPASLSITGDSLFVSLVKFESKDIDTLKPYVYIATKVGRTTQPPRIMPFVDINYAYTHPHFDTKYNRLYFSSDMPGGEGGFDIYYSELKNGKWNDPVNVSSANTSGNEFFPNTMEGVLFFSSDRNINKGLDIFWTLTTEKSAVYELKDINTEADEFGVFVLPGMKNGYYSSSKNGSDDIYFLDITKTVTITNRIAGQFTYPKVNGHASAIRVQLLDENEFVLFETMTDENGEFAFDNLALDGVYKVKAVSDIPVNLVLRDGEDSIIATLIANESDEFVYRKLTFDKSGTMSLIPDDMINFELNKGHLSAQIIDQTDAGGFLANARVSLVNSAGDEIYSTFTDKKGNFEFKNIPMNENLIIKLPQVDHNQMLLVYDSNDNVVAQLKMDESGSFVYRKMNPDYADRLSLKDVDDNLMFSQNNETIWGYFDTGNKKKPNNEGIIVKVYDESKNYLGTDSTNYGGHFRFMDLPRTQSLLFALETSHEQEISGNYTLYIYDRYGAKVAELRRAEDGFFKYRPLGFIESNELSKIEEESMEFILGAKAEKKIVLVYFDSNQSRVKLSDMNQLDKLIEVLAKNPNSKIEINAYADALSSDEYNLVLSGKRGNWIKDYMVSKGIDKKRIIVNAYGESHLIDQENHALNRRAEIRFY